MHRVVGFVAVEHRRTAGVARSVHRKRQVAFESHARNICRVAQLFLARRLSVYSLNAPSRSD